MILVRERKNSTTKPVYWLSCLHPAVEPGGGQFAVASCQGMMKP
jgi:hypothetical protein